MNRYKTINKIGEGTFSEVVKVQSLKDGNYYACKKMKQLFKSSEQVNNLREIQALRRLSPHPNILTLHEVLFDRKSGCLALICELMDMNIYELIRERRHPLPENKVRNYMYQLCRSLEHIHRNGIFHRDVKPENILIKQDVLKLADFGSCRSIFSKQPYTEYISTRWYRAPECLLTDGYYTYKMDIWSAGCVFFEICSFHPLFPGLNELDQISRIHDVLGTPQSAVLRKFKQALEKHALTRAFGMAEKSSTAGSMNYLMRIAGQGRRQQALKTIPDLPYLHHGPTFPREMPKLNVPAMTKPVSLPSLKFQSVFPIPGNAGKLPVMSSVKYINSKLDNHQHAKAQVKPYHLPTLDRKGGAL
ncbi:MAPK/MAK/MRK overlapping kinase isoform X3 [Hyperolius riggenbachi]|uniref:MAPK/MAK/MRK overlapping kinase isoform X3 n=1 Tax=Hyperolius riggenbachi TaxID=752182 RepID=UPI0035A2EBBA